MIQAADSITLSNCTITKQTHTKRKFTFFLATPENRVDSDTFKKTLEIAKRHGGWYSKKWEDTPNGYGFKEKAALIDFLEEAESLLAQGEPIPSSAENESLDDLRGLLGVQPAEIETTANETADQWRDTYGIMAEKTQYQPPAPQRSSAPNVDKWRKMADTCDKTAENCLRERLTNTPKRLGEARSQQVAGYEAQRMAEYLRAYADRAELGTLPPELAGAKLTKYDFGTAAKRKKQPVSNGYHAYYQETDQWHDTSHVSEALRQIAQDARSASNAPGIDPEAERAAQAKRDALEDGLRFGGAEGFFPTPDDLALEVAHRAQIQRGHQVLEPSAGKGDLARAIAQVAPHTHILCIEKNAQIAEVCALDFITLTQDITTFDGTRFDRIVMNPPFERGQDIAHVCYCYENLLRDGGRLVAIVANGASLQKARPWLESVGAEVEELPAGSFKNAFRSTGVSTALIIIDK